MDTGNVNHIKDALSTHLISGVTTNPSLIAKEGGKDFKLILKEIIKMFKAQGIEYTLSAEITDLSSIDKMIKQGRELGKIDKNILVKVPLTKEGLIVVSELSTYNIKCNVTLCFSATQALLAAKAGAWCVSPFVGRVEDEGWNGIELLNEIKQVFENYKLNTKILAASIRSVEHVRQAMLIGVDIVTVPKPIFDKLYYNPLTDIGIEKFERDWEEYKNARK